MKTGLITFNVRERGRQHRGVDRNFDTAALARLVNSPEVQERVRLRDLSGYFGHWPRRLFGMEPGEGGIHDGKQITLEAALVTTSLRAADDGTIEHEAEFLDTAPGRTAKRLFQSKAGGFSSAIRCREYAGRDVPVGFHGFDYVMEPNFSTNRGYALDGVDADGDAAFFDDAMRESAATVRVLDGLYSALQADYDRMAGALARMQQENNELIGMLAKGAGADRAREAVARLDAAGEFERPVRIVTDVRCSRLGSIAQKFDSIRDLPGFEAPAEPAQARELSALTRNFFDWLRR